MLFFPACLVGVLIISIFFEFCGRVTTSARRWLALVSSLQREFPRFVVAPESTRFPSWSIFAFNAKKLTLELEEGDPVSSDVLGLSAGNTEQKYPRSDDEKARASTGRSSAKGADDCGALITLRSQRDTKLSDLESEGCLKDGGAGKANLAHSTSEDIGKPPGVRVPIEISILDQDEDDNPIGWSAANNSFSRMSQAVLAARDPVVFTIT